jgi:hypothetical protein
MIMGIARHEDEWQRRATDAAIAGARKIALGSTPLMNTPVGRLKDDQWGWLVTGAIFGWVQTHCEQAIAEGFDQEDAVRMTSLSPSPCDVAAVTSILSTLADQAAIDWSLPLAAWSKETMTNFLLLAWQLINKAEAARDHGPGKILRQSAEAPAPDDLSIPKFLRRAQETQKGEWDEKKGDAIPF